MAGSQSCSPDGFWTSFHLQGFCKGTWGFPKIRGTFSVGPHNKDYSILGSISGSPYLRKVP